MRRQHACFRSTLPFASTQFPLIWIQDIFCPKCLQLSISEVHYFAILGCVSSYGQPLHFFLRYP